MPRTAARKVPEPAFSLDPALIDPAKAIINDAQFLEALGISEAQAAAYLGKTRQALHNGLSPSEDGKLPTSYFRCSDIYFLLSAKILDGEHIDAARILAYVLATRTERLQQKDGRVLLDLLKRQSGIDTRSAFALVFVLPGFSQIQDQYAAGVGEMKRWVELLRQRSNNPLAVCLSDTARQASAAGLSLRIDDDACIGNEIVEHYFPCVLAYERGQPMPRILVITRSAGLAEAPGFRTNIITNCVEDLIKVSPVRDKIRNERQKFLELGFVTA